MMLGRRLSIRGEPERPSDSTRLTCMLGPPRSALLVWISRRRDEAGLQARFVDAQRSMYLHLSLCPTFAIGGQWTCDCETPAQGICLPLST